MRSTDTSSPAGSPSRITVSPGPWDSPAVRKRIMRGPTPRDAIIEGKNMSRCAPMKILTAEQMRRIDQRAERDHGIPAETLMDNAGRAVAQTLLRLFPEAGSHPAVIVCGKGNNGGDGLAAARHLHAANARAVVLL